MDMLRIVLCIVFLVVGIALGWIIRWLYAKFQLSSAEQEAERVMAVAERDAEARKKEIVIEGKDQIVKERQQQERERQQQERELKQQAYAQQQEIRQEKNRIAKKEEALDAKAIELEQKKKLYTNNVVALEARVKVIDEKEATYRKELEKISGLTQQEAKDLIIKNMENDARHDAQLLINKIEEDAKITADKKAKEIVISAIQRVATDTTSDFTVTSVSLPGDEMKGRIIGREGRNIRALETLTGVDIIIDDTPEAVVISCFDPVRKEIARLSLERLVSDGRIHPARIEEIVLKVTHEVQQKIYEEGEKALFDLNIHNIEREGARALGRLYFRTSYGQSVLDHSKEVARLAGLLAVEVGANVSLAERAGILHDIGKGAEVDSDKNHAELGAEMAKKMGEDPKVINAIAAHHNDVEPQTVEAVLVQIADAISAARPGARREAVDNYIKRLENLEALAERFQGVEKAYAIQAGRELRVLVNNEEIPDTEVKSLARDIAKQIETDLKYPGKIKLTMIRETRIIEYAR